MKSKVLFLVAIIICIMILAVLNFGASSSEKNNLQNNGLTNPNHGFINFTPSWAYGYLLPVATCNGGAASYTRNDTGWIYTIGGITSSGLTANVRRYNVNTDIWTDMAPLFAPLEYFATTVLNNNIYVIGGYNGTNAVNSFYKYDMNSNLWTTTGTNFPIAAEDCKAVGYDDSLIYVAGGWSSNAPINNVYLYNKFSNTWREATHLPAARHYGAFSRTGDTLVYIGGLGAGNTPTPTTYIGLISRGNRSSIFWTAGADYPNGPREGWDAANWGGYGIIVAGGWNGTGYTNTCTRYSPGADIWTSLPTKPTSEYSAFSGSVHLANNIWKLIVAGGYNGSYLTSTDILTDSIPDSYKGWTTGAPLQVSIYEGGGVGYMKNDTGWLYTMGGEDSSTYYTFIQRYNVNTNIWNLLGSIPINNLYFGVAILKDSIYMIGGYNNSGFLNNVYKFDINTHLWTQKHNYPTNITECKAIGYQDSLIYVVGGWTSGTTDSVYMYNVFTDSWRAASSLPAGRASGAFSRTGDTLVYVGGVDAGANNTATTYRGLINQTNRSSITWTTGLDFPGGPRTGWDAANWGSYGIITVGGYNGYGGESNFCYRYSPGANIWTRMSNKPTQESEGFLGSVYIGNNIWKLIVAGGYYNSLLNATEIFTDSFATVGIKNISSQIPDKFILYQNYPNPFNPSTKIKFDIPAVGQRHAFDVRLKIYDIIGREITTLANETLQPGTYEVTFDGSNLPSGIYFYSITAGSFFETKKLILLK